MTFDEMITQAKLSGVKTNYDPNNDCVWLDPFLLFTCEGHVEAAKLVRYRAGGIIADAVEVFYTSNGMILDSLILFYDYNYSLPVPTKVKIHADGNCPKCGDVGEWRMLALVCRKGHGIFAG